MTLAYELEILWDAYLNVLEDGISLKVALQESFKNTCLRAKRERAHDATSPKEHKGGKRSKSRGERGDARKRGKIKQFSAQELSPQKLKVKYNERNTCFDYNNKERTCEGSAGMLHICQSCLDSLPKYDRPEHQQRQEPTPESVERWPEVENDEGVA
eukprot:1166695-Karenia_brevis.AAC.1